jgi:hypothetical protein
MRYDHARYYIAAVILSLLVGCATQPRNVPCANDGQCEKESPQFRYCLESRCVECVGSSTCGPKGSCVDGRCMISCGSDRDCPRGSTCQDSTCTGG